MCGTFSKRKYFSMQRIFADLSHSIEMHSKEFFSSPVIFCVWLSDWWSATWKTAVHTYTQNVLSSLCALSQFVPHCSAQCLLKWLSLSQYCVWQWSMHRNMLDKCLNCDCLSHNVNHIVETPRLMSHKLHLHAHVIYVSLLRNFPLRVK